jgi:hypothetical protein
MSSAEPRERLTRVLAPRRDRQVELVVRYRRIVQEGCQMFQLLSVEDIFPVPVPIDSPQP